MIRKGMKDMRKTTLKARSISVDFGGLYFRAFPMVNLPLVPLPLLKTLSFLLEDSSSDIRENCLLVFFFDKAGALSKTSVFAFDFSVLGSRIACGLSLVVGLAVSWPALFLYGRNHIPMLPEPTRSTGNATIGNETTPAPRYITAIMCDVMRDKRETVMSKTFFAWLSLGFGLCFLALVIMYTCIGRVMLKQRQMKKGRKKSREDFKVSLKKAKELHASGSEMPSTSSHAEPEEESKANTDVLESAPALSKKKTSRQFSLMSDDESSKRNDSVFSKGSGTKGKFTIGKARKYRPPKSTLMLLALSVVFLMSFIPFLIIVWVRKARGDMFYPGLSSAEKVLVNIFLRSYLVNNVANPLIYGFCNLQFRREVKKILRPIRRRRSSSSVDVSPDSEESSI
jgi:hypothetical protein